MDNIFKDAKFGDIYVTKDEHKNSFCSFSTSNGETIARLYREKWGVVFFYLDGREHSGMESVRGIDFDIIGKWEEPINEEELERIANTCSPYCDGISIEESISNRCFVEGFKAAYLMLKIN